MFKHLFIFSLLIIALSCNKEVDNEIINEVPECKKFSGLSNYYIGRWNWIETKIIYESSDGLTDSSYYMDSTDFKYYFTIDENGFYSGYKDDSLVDYFLISDQSQMSYVPGEHAIDISINCTSNKFRIELNIGGPPFYFCSNTKYPIYIYENENDNITKSYYNVFQKE